MRFLKFWDKSNTDVLSSILKDPSMREMLLGVDRKPFTNDAKVEANAARAVHYSKSEGYDIYAKEIWASIVSNIRAISDENVTAERASFYRGSLFASLEALKISYNAFQFLEGQANSRKEKPPLALRGDNAASLRN